MERADTRRSNCYCNGPRRIEELAKETGARAGAGGRLGETTIFLERAGMTRWD